MKTYPSRLIQQLQHDVGNWCCNEKLGTNQI